jgi:hypothetical protein
MSNPPSHVAENAASLAALTTWVNTLTDDQLAHPLDAGWTVAGVLAHLAFWDQRAPHRRDHLAQIEQALGLTAR